MDSDEEERLRQWKEHLASQQESDDEHAGSGHGEPEEGGSDAESPSRHGQSHAGWYEKKSHKCV